MNMAAPTQFLYNWLKAIILTFYENDIIDNNTYVPPPKIE